ncbi:DUF2889 domain-containing protein [Bordetella pseudohinzii]|uniref:Protein of uncharacterized function (DUF2889) n=1 Tax=Bordetella pseudohinzii TaxID=1331258 RepID=A0A0J6C432_9BORD|nr:DUF2889 domain-containing protein [Bordetella pseudohinzii]ANY16726.1 hypothetical protein BBN53_13025 [Bordetella pseudohinzii]KMM25526.1 hypothetical protein L540_20060 [Bordetella pseudohinzii]KXA76790.1 hypothetical protein AW878_17155 [Bordetella pseudohinzii]KXA76989.1 hypothetical protein AW877_15440 [Bordetella pseudohinzii]CUI89987.1 Protein of uncharacterised function (DUF2889) [Bordetella pseudohinzii]
MPLPPPDVPRQPLHTRSIRVQCYGREDGLFDLDAELIDVKAYDFPRRNGEIFKAGDPIHHMHLRLTIDEEFNVVAAHAAYDAAPYEASCMAIDQAYGGLVGLNLLKGFRNRVKERFGRVAGCTHMTELSQILPTAAVQMMANRRRETVNEGQRPFQLDGCHALRTDGPVVLEYYPRWYTGDSAPDTADATSESSSFSHSS